MDIILLPQPIAIALLIIAVLIPTTLFGDRFAVRVKERPFDKTWQEVVVGVFFSQLAIFLLSEGTLWILGIIDLGWWIPVVYPVLVYGITGGCQIREQEKKIVKDKLKSARINSLDDIR